LKQKQFHQTGLEEKQLSKIEPNQHIKLQRREFEVFNRLINHLIECNEQQHNKWTKAKKCMLGNNFGSIKHYHKKSTSTIACINNYVQPLQRFFYGQRKKKA